MKVCFFGWKRAFDYYQIGGTESYVRRLASGLLGLGHEVTYVMYGASQKQLITPEGFNANLYYEQRFEEALDHLRDDGFELVISTYIHPRHRPGYLLFRRNQKKDTHFSTIMFSPFRSKTKLLLGSMDLHYYDSVFVVSERIKKQIARLGVRSEVLPPPVSDVFFEAAKKRTTSQDGRIRIGYIGRADYGKGFDIAIEVMKSLDKTNYSPSILTYSWPEKDYEISTDEFEKSEIRFEITQYAKYSNEIEDKVADFLKGNDIMLFPYRTLDTTIDVPLSVVESIVAGCQVSIPNIVDLKGVFDKSSFKNLFSDNSNELAEFIQNLDRTMVFYGFQQNCDFYLLSNRDITAKMLESIKEAGGYFGKN